MLLCAILAALLWLIAAAPAAYGQEPPTPTVAVVIDTVSYDSVNDRYQLELSLVGTTQISRLVIIVKELASGTDVKTLELPPGGQLILRTELTTERLRAGQQYEMRILALDQNGARLLRPSRPDDEQNIADLSIFALYNFTYLPIEENAMGFSILAVNVDYASGTMSINVAPDETSNPDKYAGFIVDEGGQQVASIDLSVYSGSPIVVPLPAVMQQPGPQRKYTLVMTMEDKEGRDQRVDFAFAPPPPPRVGLFRRLLNTLTENPYVPATIVVIIFAAIIVQLIRTRPKPPARSPRPPVDMTTLEPMPEPLPAPVRPPTPVRPPSVASAVQARLRILESPNMGSGRDKTVSLPYVLGRKEFNDDREISREHARLEMVRGQLAITDLNSVNGTFVNEQRIPAGQQMPLGREARVRFGPSTLCEIALDSR